MNWFNSSIFHQSRMATLDSNGATTNAPHDFESKPTMDGEQVITPVCIVSCSQYMKLGYMRTTNTRTQ